MQLREFKLSSLLAVSFLIIYLILSGCNNDSSTNADNDTDDTTTSVCTTAGTADISTNASITALAAIMLEFRNALSSALLSDASFCLDDEAFYSWSNIPGSVSDRGGVTFGELSTDQLNFFYAVLNAFLSTDGFTKVSLIIQDVETFLNSTNPSVYGTQYYHIALFGDPETDGSWGFQLDGHHCAINFFVHGGAVSIVPAFIAAEPAIINGTGVFDDERNLAFTLLNSLDAAQQTTAIQSGRRALQVGPGDAVDPYLNYDYSIFDGIGLRASAMTSAQQETLRNLIKEYVYNLETEFADEWMADVEAGFGDTYFVWIGNTGNSDAIYYRIYNPAVWIEYNNEDILSSTDPLDHVHTITRSSNGNDYGIFALNSSPKTLLEHYASVDHHNRKDVFDYYIGDMQEAAGHKHNDHHPIR